ncbi:MAG: uracil phosphoribosyltransferase [Candidatus Kapaibacterium sp.]|nr:uracil phosphoribosyltransferase [Bacteroidota bacterium]
MVTILSNSVLACDITTIRNKNTAMPEFRAAMERIGYHLAVSVTQNIPICQHTIQTPLEETAGCELQGDVVIVPILRAALSILHPFTALIPTAKVGYLGLKRNEQTLEPYEYYANIPALTQNSTVIIIDPMLATGGSITAAISHVQKAGATNIQVAAVIAAPEGIACIQNVYPDVSITVAVVDRMLNEHGYIVPGLGDAGDRVHGTE